MLDGLAATVEPGAQQRPQPRQQLTHREGLRDIIVGACIQRRDLLRFLIAHGQDEDRHARPFADRGDHRLAVHVRQAEIEHDAVRRRSGGEFDPLPAALRLRHIMPAAGKRDAQEAADGRVILDQQQAGAGRLGSGVGVTHVPSSVGGAARGSRSAMVAPRWFGPSLARAEPP